ncbi:MAG: polyhydroxyalkanoate synthesis regulator DNA-binding domain-containing protein [Sandaracinaceae bacterium]|nr:polyhydroxyalkanoate synthesis regulator DNA-binding domain-containing protein [Sandaracinaceae bacterium]
MSDDAAQTRESKKTGTRIVKRYANRKLYDTRDSRYVTLVQIAQYVRAGEDVQIIDNTTKENVTNVTLAQIIYEQEKKGEIDGRVASVGTLRHFIQSNSHRLMESLREGPVGKLIARREDEVGPANSAHDEPRRTMLSASKEALEELQRTADDRLRALVSSAIAPVHYLQSEVKRLQERIDELEATLVKASQPRSVPPKGKGSTPPESR